MGFSGSGRRREAAPGAAWVAAARVRSFGISGFQGGLLRQLDCFHRRRGPTMLTLKPGRQLTLPNLDQHPPGRPALVQRRVDADDLPHRRFPRIGVGPVREPYAESVVEVVFQGGVVGLRRRPGRLEQHPAVDG